jgi:hypothetical protein
MGETTGLQKKYGIAVTFNGMISQLNFMKIYQFVQKLLVGGMDRQHGDLIILTFLFKLIILIIT